MQVETNSSPPSVAPAPRSITPACACNDHALLGQYPDQGESSYGRSGVVEPPIAGPAGLSLTGLQSAADQSGATATQPEAPQYEVIVAVTDCDGELELLLVLVCDAVCVAVLADDTEELLEEVAVGDTLGDVLTVGGALVVHVVLDDAVGLFDMDRVRVKEGERFDDVTDGVAGRLGVTGSDGIVALAVCVPLGEGGTYAHVAP